MKINLIESFCNQYVGFVRVVAEDGSFGWGQLSNYNTDITQQVLHRQVAPWVLGRNVGTPAMLNDALDLVTEKEHKFPGSYYVEQWLVLIRRFGTYMVTTRQACYGIAAAVLEKCVPMHLR